MLTDLHQHAGTPELGPEQLANLTETLARECSDWWEFITPDPDQRVYRQIWDHPAANAWLIAWCPGQDTGWHDHDDAGATLTALHGEIVEERMRLDGGAVSTSIRPGQVFHVPASAIHRVRHAGTGNAVTVHCYSPPLRRMGTYSVGTHGELLRDAGVERAGASAPRLDRRAAPLLPSPLT